MNEFLNALRKYATIRGRSTRAEFNWFYVFDFIFIFLATVADILGLLIFGQFMYISTLTGLALLLPAITVGVRRFHDLGKSGWYSLLFFIPLINMLIFFWLCFADSQEGENEYGLNPKVIGNPLSKPSSRLS